MGGRVEAVKEPSPETLRIFSRTQSRSVAELRFGNNADTELFSCTSFAQQMTQLVAILCHTRCFVIEGLAGKEEVGFILRMPTLY